MRTKALIVANVGSVHRQDGIEIPSCFLKVFNEMTIVERLVSLLNINKIPNEDIYIQCGTGDIWESNYVKKKIKDLGPAVFFEEKTDIVRSDLFKNGIFDDSELIIIEGNAVIDIAIISRLKRYRHPNAIVVDEVLNPDELRRLIVVNDGNVDSVKSSEEIDYPWMSFAGIMKLSREAVISFGEHNDGSMDLLDLIQAVSSDVEISAITYEDLVYGKLNGGYSEELTGGSYSKLNYRLVVKKESDNEGRQKLKNEIKWLLSLPNELKPYFSQVLEYDIAGEKVYYDVPYYGSRNLRERIFDGHLDADAACDFIISLIKWMFKNVYKRVISDAPEDWASEKHIRRVLERLPECSAKSPVLGKLIASDRIVINGVEYRNVKGLFEKMSKMKSLLKDLSPKTMVMIHGDLHFQNILMTNETDTGFILVDPRGEIDGSDYYYDLGKLWHSFHAKYDFFHTDQFELKLEWKNGIPYAIYEITNRYVEKVYDQIYEKMQTMIQGIDCINSDPHWEMKVLFAEASHLCSVSTFHIGKTDTDDRPVVLYLRGVQLINEFYDRFVKGSNYLEEIQ